jgi:hypothetical protein
MSKTKREFIILTYQQGRFVRLLQPTVTHNAHLYENQDFNVLKITNLNIL